MTVLRKTNQDESGLFLINPQFPSHGLTARHNWETTVKNKIMFRQINHIQLPKKNCDCKARQEKTICAQQTLLRSQRSIPSHRQARGLDADLWRCCQSVENLVPGVGRFYGRNVITAITPPVSSKLMLEQHNTRNGGGRGWGWEKNVQLNVT